MCLFGLAKCAGCQKRRDVDRSIGARHVVSYDHRSAPRYPPARPGEKTKHDSRVSIRCHLTVFPEIPTNQQRSTFNQISISRGHDTIIVSVIIVFVFVIVIHGIWVWTPCGAMWEMHTKRMFDLRINQFDEILCRRRWMTVQPDDSFKDVFC